MKSLALRQLKFMHLDATSVVVMTTLKVYAPFEMCPASPLGPEEIGVTAVSQYRGKYAGNSTKGAVTTHHATGIINAGHVVVRYGWCQVVSGKIFDMLVGHSL